jgi:hypothetical protein
MEWQNPAASRSPLDSINSAETITSGCGLVDRNKLHVGGMLISDFWDLNMMR